MIHESAHISPEAKIGEGTRIWHNAQIREKAELGKNCIIGKNVYIDHHVKIGNNVKIQNNCSIYFNTIVEDGVFIAPHVIFTNDHIPRAVNPDGSLKTGGSEAKDWKVGTIIVKEGASICTNSTLLTDITIGKWALVGAGSVVTKSVPDYGLVVGIPARLRGFVCKCGFKLMPDKLDNVIMKMICTKCRMVIDIPKKDYELVRQNR